jgi:hypothetical protein
MYEKSGAGGVFIFIILLLTAGILVSLILLLGSMSKLNENQKTVLEEVQKSNDLLFKLTKGETIDLDISTSDSAVSDDEDEEEEEEEDNEDSSSDDEEEEEEASDEEEATQEEEELEEGVDISAVSLFELYDEDKESADEKYQGATITVSGEYLETTETDNDKVKIELNGGSDSKLVVCLSPVTDSYTQAVVEEDLAGKDKIKVKGVVDSYYDEVELENCKVVD